MSAQDDLLKAIEAFRGTAAGNGRLSGVMDHLDHAVLTLRHAFDSPGARASRQAQDPNGKYQQYKEMTFNGAGQEPSYPSEEPGRVQSA